MERPNVVLITLDTTRQDRLSCYGYERPTSPNIDAFAQEATVYEDAIAPSIWSLPSHASLFTGMYPHEHGATFISPFLDNGPTIAEQLGEKGYQTIGIAPSFVVRPSAGLDQGFESFETPEVLQLPGPLIGFYQQYTDIIGSARTLRKTSESIWRLYRDIFQSKEEPEKEWKRSTKSIEQAEAVIEDADEPFFLFLNLMDPHLPHHPEARFREGFVDADRDVEAPKHPDRYNVGDSELTEDQMEHLSQLYDADIRALDHRVGRVLDTIKEAGIWDETMIVLVADHGEHLGEDGMIGHEYSVAEEVISVPLLIKFPDQTDQRRVETPVETRKVYHTILDQTIRASQESLKDPDEGPVIGEYFAPMVDPEVARQEGRLEYVRDAVENPIRFMRDSDHKIVSYQDDEVVLILPEETEIDTDETDHIKRQMVQQATEQPPEAPVPGEDLPV